jgi:hypothetical protein
LIPSTGGVGEDEMSKKAALLGFLDVRKIKFKSPHKTIFPE